MADKIHFLPLTHYRYRTKLMLSTVTLHYYLKSKVMSYVIFSYILILILYIYIYIFDFLNTNYSYYLRYFLFKCERLVIFKR